MIAYNWFDCDIQPQPAFINWAAGCVCRPVPPDSRSKRLTLMPCLPFFEWCEAIVARQQPSAMSLWLFPVIEAVHLLGLCVLGGAVLLVDLRLLGVGLRHPIRGDRRVTRRLAHRAASW